MYTHTCTHLYKEGWARKNQMMLSNCAVGEDSWEFLLFLQGDQTKESILTENNPEYSLEELMLKLQYFGHMTQTAKLTGKDPDAGKDWKERRRGQQGIRLLDCITDSMDMNLSNLQEIVKDRGAWNTAVSMGSQRVGHDLATEQQQIYLLMERGFPGGPSGPRR